MRDFNLLPEYVITQKKNREVEKIAMTVCTVIIGAVCLITAWWFGSNQLYQHKADAIKGKVGQISFVVEQKNNIDIMNKDMEAKRKAKQFVTDQEQIVLKDLNLIEEVLNKDITVTSIIVDGSKVKISCVAKDKETVARFLNKLRKDTNFTTTAFIKNIGPEEGKDSTDKSRSFEMELEVK